MFELAGGLLRVTDPEILKEYGWKAPYPSYVIAAPSLWAVWLQAKKQSDARDWLFGLRPVSGTDPDFDYETGRLQQKDE